MRIVHTAVIVSLNIKSLTINKLGKISYYSSFFLLFLISPAPIIPIITAKPAAALWAFGIPVFGSSEAPVEAVVVPDEEATVITVVVEDEAVDVEDVVCGASSETNVTFMSVSLFPVENFALYASRYSFGT